MKNSLVAVVLVLLILVFTGCATEPKTPAPVVQTAAESTPITIEFGPNWTGTIRLEQEAKPDLGDKAEAHFYSEWTLDESAGIVYPKTFTSSDTGAEEAMDFLWDTGGDIDAGTYDVRVDIDGTVGSGTIRNLTLEKGTAYNVYVSFRAAKMDIELQTDGDDVYVFPSGTYEKYEGLGRLDSIPEEIIISHVNSYTERNPIYRLIPAGTPLDILRTYSGGDAKWYTDYIATPESVIRQLP